MLTQLILAFASTVLFGVTTGRNEAINCEPNFPFMSAGDYNITRDNFDRYSSTR
jgi:hypothetical protein